MRTVASALTGLCAAAACAVAALLQQLAAREMLTSRSLRPAYWSTSSTSRCGLLGWRHARGIRTSGDSSGARSVPLVAPIIATELAFALPVAMSVGHLRAGLKEWVATLCVVAGVALFVVVSNPRPGSPVRRHCNSHLVPTATHPLRENR
jgi:hypothetical protein